MLGRPGCHLCEDFEHELRAHAGAGLEIECADVDSRNGWRERYGDRIPVLVGGDDEVICEGRFDAAALDRYLAAPSL